MIKILVNKKNLYKYNDYISSILFNFNNFNIIIIDDLCDIKIDNENKINNDIDNENKINNDNKNENDIGNEKLYIINYIKNNLGNTFIFLEYFNEKLFEFLRTYYLLNIYYLNISKTITITNQYKPYFFIINYFDDKHNKLILNYQIRKNTIKDKLIIKNKNIAFIKNKNNVDFNVKNIDKIKDIEILDFDILYDTVLDNFNYLLNFKIIIFLEIDLHELNILKYVLNKSLIFIHESIDINIKDFEKFIIKYNNNNLTLLLNEVNYENIIDNSIIKNIDIKVQNNNTYLLNHFNNIDKKDNIDINSNDFGFIILRHVNNKQTNQLWKTNIKNIRKYYNNKIYIIDDNSNEDFLDEEISYYKNCFLIKSEFKKRGEILPYYYLFTKKLFEKVLIIHDGTFINKFIDFKNIKEEIIYLWHFTHDWDNREEELKMLHLINNNNLTNFYKTKEWYGCFGIQSIISLDFINKIYNKYNFDKLLEYIDERPKRMNFERIFSVICTYENNKLYQQPSLYGIIHHYIHWGYNYESYEDDIKNKRIEHLPLIKIWNGR